MKNDVSVQPWRSASVFVGPLDVTYGYDALNQLRTMSSKYRPHVAYGYQSADTFTYDEIGNIKTKAQSQDRLVWDNQTVNTLDLEPVDTQLPGSRFDHNVAGLTYNLAYQYTGTRPHATNSITETPAGSAAASRPYTYDPNGNNTGNSFQQNNREQLWDEESRLKQVKRNGGSLAQFRYDDEGERTKKLTAAGDAWYVNQYFALLPNNRPTKHIYAGETRVATKTDAINMQTPILHYYHPDHLGTTSYLSDKDQRLVQHERYFAFGELWRPGGEQEETDLSRPDGDRREWLFTGKEWDVDTGLYYFGARYFDPHTDVWQSTDPILASYMRGRVNGGVFSPGNLGLYTYSYNNPIVLKDPDGDAPVDFGMARLISSVTRGNPPVINPSGKATLRVIDRSSAVATTFFRPRIAHDVAKAFNQVEAGAVRIVSSKNAPDPKSLGKGDFTLYLVSGSDTNEVSRLAAAHGLSKEAIRDIQSELDRGHGVTVKGDRISFVPVEAILEDLKAGNSAQEAVADALGNLTKHELGHSVSPRRGQDYDHSTRGVMSSPTPAYPAGYSPEFRKVLKDRIDK